MAPGRSNPRSGKPVIITWPEPDGSSPHTYTPFKARTAVPSSGTISDLPVPLILLRHRY